MEFIIRRTSDFQIVGPKPIESAILKEFWYKGGVVVDNQKDFKHCFEYGYFAASDLQEKESEYIKFDMPNTPIKGYAWVIEINEPSEILDIIESVCQGGRLMVEFSEEYQMPSIAIVDCYLD